MNPLAWRREHRIALLSAVALGLLVGFMAGLHFVNPYSSLRWGRLWCGGPYDICVFLLNGFWLKVSAWAAVGGIAGGTAVYIARLSRS